MKWISLLLMCCLSVSAFAQGKTVRKIAKAATVDAAQISRRAFEATEAYKAAQKLGTVRVVQGKIMLSRHPITIPSPLNKNIFSPIRPAVYPNMDELFIRPGPEQIRLAHQKYHEAMQHFIEFKRYMDPILYYQAKPSERRELSQTELAAIMARINEAHEKLKALTDIIDRTDPALRAANEYVEYAVEVISPTLMGFYSAPKKARADRKFSMSEFYMHTPEELRETGLSTWLPLRMRVHRMAQQLPKGLKIAVLNDDERVLRDMKRMHKSGLFCPDWELSVYDRSEALLTDVAHGRKFDIILTDLLVPGGGGYYVTKKLRDDGFNGLIIAASAYEESRFHALEMFHHDFDGMFSVSIGFTGGDDWTYRFMKGFRNYFYYRQKYGWKR